MLFTFFSETLYSIVKEGTTRWLKGLVGCCCFTEVSSQGAWWWPPGSVVLQTQPPLATEEPFRQQKAGPIFALLGLAVSSEVPVAACTDTPPQTKPSSSMSYPMPHEAKGQILPRKGPVLFWRSPISVQCISSQQRKGMNLHWHI